LDSRSGWPIKRNPLTPRVIVNRIWQSYFGEGLVTTPEDFGTALRDAGSIASCSTGWRLSFAMASVGKSGLEPQKRSSTDRPFGHLSTIFAPYSPAGGVRSQQPAAGANAAFACRSGDDT
jgi:hypothetical protein